MSTGHEFNNEGATVARELFVLMLDGGGRIAGVSFPLGSPARQDDEGDAWVGKHIHEVFVPSGWHGSSASAVGQIDAITGTYTAASVLNAGLTAFSVNVVALPERAVSTLAYAAYARPLLSAKAPVSRETLAAAPEPDTGQALQRVVGGLAHDINNALFVITGLAEELLDDGEDSGVNPADHLNTIIAKVRQVGEKAHQIARLSEVPRPPASPIAVQPTVEAVSCRLRATAPAGVQVQIHLNAEDALARVYPKELERILELAFSNALDALPSTGGTVEIGLSHGSLGGGTVLTLWVKDNGRGMSAEQRSRCLDPYYSTKEKAGLGLSMIKALARGMRAPLSIDSSPETGTRVQWDIPVEPAP